MAQARIDMSEGNDSVTNDAYGTSARARYNFSHLHLKLAAFQTRRALAIERELIMLPESVLRDLHAAATEDHRFVEHQACVVGAIFAAAAAMDAGVSEVYVDAWEKVAQNSQVFLNAQLQEIARRTAFEDYLAVAWDFVRNKSMRERARTALDRMGTNLGTLSSWKDVDLFLDLRNLLTHYTLGSIIVESTVPKYPVSGPTPLEAKLQAKNLGLNPLAPDSAHFPVTYLSYGCAAWAVTTSRAFIEEFWRVVEPARSALYRYQGQSSPFAITEIVEREQGLLSSFSVKPDDASEA